MDSYDYDLPAGRIAQQPLEERDSSRLLHYRPGGLIEDRIFSELPGLLAPDDLLVINDVKVRQARLRANLDTGGQAELLVLAAVGKATYECMTRPARKLRTGSRLRLRDGTAAEVMQSLDEIRPGLRVVAFETENPDQLFAMVGETPLPPYIRSSADGERYQTVYATGSPSASAAPTAGFHFTQSVLTTLAENEIRIARIQLEVGLGTFAPIAASDLREHSMHTEHYTLPPETAGAIARTRKQNGRVVAVGTTVLRVLESCATAGRLVVPRRGSTSLFIRPGYRVQVADALLTNFHQPRSSLLVLLATYMADTDQLAQGNGSAGPGRLEPWRLAYEHALEEGYRFLSFGDCMLCYRGSLHQ